MKNYSYVGFATVLFFVGMAGSDGCNCNQYGDFKITRPSKNQTHITSPYDLRVEHTGCGTVNLETFKAWLDKGTPDEKDISNAFYYSGRVWAAENYELPLGSHTFAAEAELIGSSSGCQKCYGGWQSDTRQFLVSESTCIQGKVFGYFLTDPSNIWPLEATIEVFRSGTEELLASNRSDVSGDYCIDNIPLGILLDIHVSEPQGVGCNAEKKAIDTGVEADKSCSQANCIEIEDMIAVCAPD